MCHKLNSSLCVKITFVKRFTFSPKEISTILVDMNGVCKFRVQTFFYKILLICTFNVNIIIEFYALLIDTLELGKLDGNQLANTMCITVLSE